MERGEVEEYCESLESVIGRRPDWIASGAVNVLFHGGARSNPVLEAVPFVNDLAKSDDDRKAIEFLYAGPTNGNSAVEYRERGHRARPYLSTYITGGPRCPRSNYHLPVPNRNVLLIACADVFGRLDT